MLEGTSAQHLQRDCLVSTGIDIPKYEGQICDNAANMSVLFKRRHFLILRKCQTMAAYTKRVTS